MALNVAGYVTKDQEGERGLRKDCMHTILKNQEEKVVLEGLEKEFLGTLEFNILWQKNCVLRLRVTSLQRHP